MLASQLHCHKQAIECQTTYAPETNVPYDSSSSDDGEDTVVAYKAALAKRRELQETKQFHIKTKEMIKKLEEMVQPNDNNEQSTEGQADMEVEEEQEKKVAAAKEKEFFAEQRSIEPLLSISADIRAVLLAELQHQIAE